MIPAGAAPWPQTLDAWAASRPIWTPAAPSAELVALLVADARRMRRPRLVHLRPGEPEYTARLRRCLDPARARREAEAVRVVWHYKLALL